MVSFSSSCWFWLCALPAFDCSMSNDQRLMSMATPFEYAALRIAFTPSMCDCGISFTVPSEL